MVEKCGGVVVKHPKKHLVANMGSMNQKMMKMMKRIRIKMKNKRIGT